MQLGSGGQDHLVVGPQPAAIGVVHFEDGGLYPPQRMKVSQAPSALLEVGLQLERHLAAAPVALGHPLGQQGKPPPGAATPLVVVVGGQVGSQLGVAGDVAGIQQRRGRVQVGLGQITGLPGRAHRMAELQPLVPDGVPQPGSDFADVGAVTVQEQQVDVAVRAQLGPPVPSHRHHGDALGIGHFGGEDALEPLVGPPGQCPAQHRSHHGAVGQKLIPAQCARPRLACRHYSLRLVGDASGTAVDHSTRAALIACRTTNPSGCPGRG